MLKSILLVTTASLGLLACSEKSANAPISAIPSATTTQPAHPGAALAKKNCFACHKPGLNGAPIIGNIKM